MKLLGIKYDSLNAIDSECRTPLWLGEWVFVLRVQSTDDSILRPAIVIKANMDSI